MSLVRHPRKLVRPGQWVLAKVPEFLKKRSPDFEGLDAAYICIVPEYSPIYDSEDGFRWWYSINWRRPFTAKPGEYPCEGARYKWPWSHRTQHRVWETDYKTGERVGYSTDYSLMSSYDFDLIEYNSDHRCPPPYDTEEGRRRYSGQGGYLYTPASDDPEECPGPDYSLYQCTDCEKWVCPHSDDSGTLVCPNCGPLLGLVHGVETADQIERCRALANYVGPPCRIEFENRLGVLARTQGWCLPAQTILGTEDKFSFYFQMRGLKDGKWYHDMNGGLIMHGPSVSIGEDGAYAFSTWDYGLSKSRPATPEEIRYIHWSTHT